MEITFFGIIFITICICVSIFLPAKYLIAIVIYSCIFQSVAVINFSNKGFPPYIIASIFLVVKNLLNPPDGIPNLKTHIFIRYIFVFVLFALFSSLVLPHLWKGITVFTWMDNGEFGEGNLRFKQSNVIQIFYLVLNFLTIYIIYINRSKIPVHFIRTVFIYSIITVIIIGLWSYFSIKTGLPFPHSFFYNNSGYSIVRDVRLKSLFTEPSFCGAFLSASFCATIGMTNKYYKLLCIFIGICLLLSLSGTGIVSLIISIVLFLCLKGFKWVICFAPFIILIIYGITSIEYFDIVTNKMDSHSGLVRSTSAYFTFDLFLQTKCIGIGLGSHRGSSFILDMLVSLGIVGTYLFCKIYAYLLKYAIRTENNWIFKFIITLLIAQCIGVPDFSFSIMWMGLFMATAILPDIPRTRFKCS
jgi:hypothetical protein